METYSIIYLTLLLIALLHVTHALINVRSSQGAVAWIIGLIILPWLAIPFYWFAGRTRFNGYVRAKRASEERLRESSQLMKQSADPHLTQKDAFIKSIAKKIDTIPSTKGNKLELLIDGEETFDSIFKTIENAKSYLILQYYQIRGDNLGNKLKDELIKKSQQGVKVFFLYDGYGSLGLSKHYLEQMTASNIHCSSFAASKKWWSKLQLNFRNHRKLVIADGEVAYMGGLNVGDEYLGRSEQFGDWRDTHLRLHGPSVMTLQLAFIEDWNWATGETPELNWETPPDQADQTVAILPTGPTDSIEAWKLTVAEALNQSESRFWISSPYFVPDEGILTAMKTAALRGVDVRILIPEKHDHWSVWLAAFSYQRDILPHGIRIFRYHEGFLHQKVFIKDTSLCCIGSANLDNRSFRLNFEISALSQDLTLIDQVSEMLEKAFSISREITDNEVDQRPFHFKLLVRAARLFSPIL